MENPFFKPQEKTLVILAGNPRGGEKTWHSMYDNLLKPYNADLALCFGYQEDKSSSLYSTAKYVWQIPEYKKWEEYYIEHLGADGPWKKSFELGSRYGFSGLYDSVGSGAIWCAFIHYVHLYKKQILQSYDRIIMTRADHYYVKPVEVLSNDYFWVPTGEHYGGINDRFHIFPSKDVDYVLGVVSNYINTETFYEDFKDYLHFNMECSLSNYFNRTGYIQKVKTFPRVLFLVKTRLDTSRWTNGEYTVPYNDDLLVKYGHEFEVSMSNIPEEKHFEVLNRYKNYEQAII
jgi:hypothetical protein